MLNCTSFLRVTAFAAAFGLSALLTGCSMSTTAAPTPVNGSALQGMVHGGQQGVIGASVYLLEAATGAYGGPGVEASPTNLSKSLLTSQPNTHFDGTNYYTTTDAYGFFSVGGDYTCDSNQVVYVYVIGGNTGSGTNSKAAFMAVLGTCPNGGGNLASIAPFVWVNEVSTVAAAYSLAGFATDAKHIGYSGSTLGLTGIQNAAANTKNLADLATGTVATHTVGNNGTIPSKLINTLANILAACINTTDAVTSSANCNTLFGNMKSNGANGIMATDTATAAIYFAHNPSQVNDNLFNLQAAIGAPFQAPLMTKPNDWGMAVSYTGGGMAAGSQYMLAVDGSGNVWTANGGLTEHTLGRFSPQGVASTVTGGGLLDPQGIAIDASGNVWTTNVNNSQISEFSNDGTALSPSHGYATDSAVQTGIAVDASGNIWASVSGHIEELFASGPSVGTLKATIPTGGGQSFGYWLAIDSGGFIWTVNGNTSVSKFSSAGANQFSSTGAATPANSTEWISFDAGGNAWIVDSNATQVAQLNSNGTTLASTTTAGGISIPFTIQVDAAGSVWVPNSTGTGISKLAVNGANITGSGEYSWSLGNPIYAAALDGSGNVWGIDSGQSLVQWIGIATPQYTPVMPSKYATRP